MTCKTRKRLHQAAIILAIYAVLFGLPSTLLSGNLIDIPILAVIFAIPTWVLLGPLPQTSWSHTHGRIEEHS